MQLSADGQKWLKGVEKLALQPYDDQTGKKIQSWCKGATIGYGHLIRLEEWPLYRNGITKEQADALFLRDISPFEGVVRQTNVPMRQHEFDACVILSYNIGIQAFRSSTVRKYIVDKNFRSAVYPSLERAWKAFNKSQGKVNAGVVNRRAAEWDMYSRNLYRYW